MDGGTQAGSRSSRALTFESQAVKNLKEAESALLKDSKGLYKTPMIPDANECLIMAGFGHLAVEQSKLRCKSTLCPASFTQYRRG